MLVSWW